MSAAATSKRRPSADPFVALVQERPSTSEGRRDWTKPTLATVVSLVAHAVLLGILAFQFVKRPSAEYAEVAPIEASLDIPIHLFDNEMGEIDTAPQLAQAMGNESDQENKPLKLESPTDDAPNLQGVGDAGMRVADPAAAGNVKAGDGVGPAGGGDPGKGVGRVNFPNGMSAVGRRIVYVIDRSASMNKPAHAPAIEWAKDELIRSIKSLQPNMSFQIVFYSDTVLTLPVRDKRKDLIPATEFNKEEAVRFVRDLDAEGGTNHMIGLDKGFELKPDVVFFMTDADDDSDDDLRRLINRIAGMQRRLAQNQSPASIHLLQLWHRDDNPSPVIRELPQKNNGSYKLLRAKDLAKRNEQ